jgi:hypothetical protein
MNYDARKLPLGTLTHDLMSSELTYCLGKLAKTTILNGFEALKVRSVSLQFPVFSAILPRRFQRSLKNLMATRRRSTAVGALHVKHSAANTIRESLQERVPCTLSSVSTRIIPHDFGRQRPVIINDNALLKRVWPFPPAVSISHFVLGQELDLVDALGDMEVASKLIASTIHADEDGNPVNPIDAQFKSLNLTTMDPLDKNGKEYKGLAAYVQNTHGKTHGHINVKILDIYRVERSDRLIKASNIELTSYFVDKARVMRSLLLVMTGFLTESECYSGTVPGRLILLVF